jgi:hypothetical protein
MHERMDAAGAVDAKNAPTAPWKTAQNAVSHSAHTHPRYQEKQNGTKRQTALHTKFRTVPFRRFLRIARGSLTETRNHLRDGRDRGYLTDAKHEELSRLTARAAGATTRLMVYLHSCKPKAHGG